MRVMVSWSSGKDCAWALQRLRADPGVEVVGLFTAVNREFDRVAMHGVRRSLLATQAAGIGLPLHTIPIPHPCPNEAYEAAMSAFVEEARAKAVTHFAFGDLFLEDVRRYREERLAGTGIEPLFPLWGEATRALAREMVARGLRAFVTCVDPRQAPREWAGRMFDGELLAAMPAGVDPCGERGEFHTFVCDGPMFREPVSARPGEVVEREGFVFADLLPDGYPLRS